MRPNEFAETTSSYTCSSTFDRIASGKSVDYASIASGSSKYTDTDFSYASTDVYYWSDYYSGDLSSTTVASYSMARASDRISGLSILGDDTSYNKDIYQGSLGDCYFLAALAAIGEEPDRIKDVILTQTYNSAGIFAAEVFIRGVPTLVTVDDYLPFKSSSSKTLAFAK
jgi:hypothetical protein